jgi:hypothetical protein
MPIIKTKWKAQWNCTVIEKFYYTEDGRFFPDICAAQQRCISPDEAHEGRIMLDRQKQGRFFVDWSTRNMFKIEHEVLGLCREKLREYLDSLRTKSLVSDVETWTKIILWSWDSTAVRAAAALGADGKVVRLAIWDDAKKQYIPKQDLVGCSMEYESYTVERWRQVESGMTLAKEYQDADHNLDAEMHFFKLRDNNPVHMKVMRSLRDSIRKQTLALQGEHAAQEHARQTEEKKPGGE